MSVAPFDHPFLSGLLGDDEIARLFSAEADLTAMIAFETALAEAEADEGVIPVDAARAIVAAAGSFKPDMSELKAATARDGVVVPELVRQLRAAVGEPHDKHVHFGATSQDVVDTSLTLRLIQALDILAVRIGRLIEALDALEARDGGKTVMAHTRMQAAIPVPASRKIASWRYPLTRHKYRVEGVRDASALLAFAGAVGTLDQLGDKAKAVSENLARRLKLRAPDRARHSERDGIAVVASVLSTVTGSLGKMGADIALAVQTEVGEIKLATGGGSSAMPHKVNPVGAEILVTLARFNATLLSGMHHSLVHENERSGAAWSLEWMLLPQMAVATGASLRTAADLVAAISFVEKK
ncbi:MAG TPA: 3-carboxy-cis,cis-muconate cycloisomerase [Rhizobiaceae bacterium]|nr:3-carboxy-cis,cis-muconate cycloisomerase [Rhizobiaceae bacterium]